MSIWVFVSVLFLFANEAGHTEQKDRRIFLPEGLAGRWQTSDGDGERSA